MEKTETILGVDYGRKKIGLAIARSFLAEPWQTLTVVNFEQTVKKIIKICQKEKIKKIILGFPQGPISKEVKKLKKEIEKNFFLKVILWDETLTSRESQEIMKKIKTPRIKKKEKEHQISAALLLQDYLDSRQNS